MKFSELNLTIKALYLMRKDRRVPKRSKILISIAVGYALSPVDLIPDFIPILGQLDDLLIVPALVGVALKSIPREVLEEYKAKVQQTKLTKRFNTVTLIIVIIWTFVVIWLIQSISKFF